MNYLKRIINLLLFVIFIGFFIGVFTGELFSAEGGIESKISIDTNLENRVKKILTEITGNDKIIVIVNTELYTEKEKKGLKLTPVEERPKEILPGVPIKENIAERKIEDLLAPLDMGDTKTQIKRMTATVILDKSLPESVAEICKKVAAGLLGFQEERGDQLIVERMTFHKNAFSWESLIYPPDVFWVIGIALTAVFVLISLLFFFGPFKSFSTNFISQIGNYLSQQQARAAESVSGEFNAAAPEQFRLQESAGQKTSGTDEEKKHFYFINTDNINTLLPILKKEAIKNIAIVMNYLDKSLTSQVFNELTVLQKSDVLLQLSTMQDMDPELVKLVEQKMRSKLDYTLGSEDMLLDLMAYTDKQLQTKILSSISQTNPEISNRLSKLIFNFDDIIKFDPQTIQIIVKRTNLTVFAQLIKTGSNELQSKILGALPEAAQKRLSQEIELGKPLSEKQLMYEKRKLIELVRRLNAEGIIKL